LKKKLFIENLFLGSIGILSSLSLTPFNFFMINFFTFSSLYLFLNKKLKQKTNVKIFFLYGWAFGFGFFLTNLYWISISLTFDQNFKFLIPFTLVLLPSFLALFYGLISYFFAALKPKSVVSSFFIFSLIFGVIEFLRGIILTGFPWNLIVYSLSNQLELLSITSIIGTYGLNLFCISLFTSPAIIFLSKSKKNILVCVFFVITFTSFYLYGSSQKDSFYKADSKIYEHKIRIIGSNISLDRFYTSANTVAIIEDLIKLSSPNNSEKTIFIWPEGIFPDISQKELKEFKSLFDQSFNENHFFVIGINKKVSNNRSTNFFNSLSVYDSELNILDSYDKINLVPFGEYLPFESILKVIGLRSLTNNYQPFSKGEKRKLIEIEHANFTLKVLPLICYEIIYSGRLFQNSNYDFIVNISEDGWFGKSIGPKQHFDHSIFRAIENGKYILRSSNNGIAAIINPIGIVEQRVEFGESGYVDLEEMRKIQPTIFSKYGNKIFGLITLLYILLIFSFIRIKNE
tara:strand:+ start:672 stop:2216 length:1545 start_codon:yes stop_codon:yes gene_type:complete